MAFKKRRLIQAISDRCPKDAESLLEATKKEIWPFLQQVRRLLWEAMGSTDPGGQTGSTTVIVNEGDTNTTVISTTINPSPFDDHLVKARTLDATSVGGLKEKTAGDDGITCTVKTDSDGVERLHIGYEHPPDNSAAVATRLYTARVPDPRNHGFFTCCYLGPHFTGGNTPMLAGWNVLSPGVYEYPTPGPIPPEWLDGIDVRFYDSNGISTMVGKTVLAYYEGDTSLLGDEEKLQQLFVIEDAGTYKYHDPADPLGVMRVGSSKARLRRVTDYSLSSQWVQYMTFQCQAGTRYGTDFFTLDNASVTLGTTAIEWAHTEGPTFDWNDTYELLTGPQLSSRGASTAIEVFDWSFASGDAAAPKGFETILGTPGVSVLPAGPYLFDIEQIWLDAVPSGTTTTLRVQLLADNGVTAPVLLTAESPPLGTTPGPLSFGYDDAGHTIGNTDRLVLLYWLHTDSVTPVRVHLRYNSPTRGTRVTLPFEMAISGAADGDHNHLSNRGIRGQHPTLAVDPAPQAFITISAGVMPAVAYGSWANVTAASANLDAMDASGFPDYGEREVYFGVGCKLRSDQSTTGTNRPLRTYKGTASVYQEFTARAGATVRFRYRPDLGASGMWLLTGVQQG